MKLMHVSKLFTSQQWRELKLISYLTENSNAIGVKDKELSKALNISMLTLQSCLTNMQFMKEVGGITYKDGYINIWYHQCCGLQEVYQKALRESPSLKLLELLFFRNFSSLEELAEELFVSLSTLKRLIKKTNTYLSHTFAISIVTSPVQVSGDERQIRLFYLKYFSEAYKISEWPFGDILNLKNCERLLSLLIKEVDVKVHFTLFQHLKILSGVNLIRYYKGYSCSYNNKKTSHRFSQLIQHYSEIQDLSRLFYLKFGLHLDEYTIAEMFSNHLNDKLEIGCAFEIINQDPTSGGRQVTNWIHLLDEMEIKLNLSITNKYEVAVTLHNASVLNEEDITANYLLFDYKKSYLNFYQKEHPRIYEAFVTSVEKLMQADNAQVSKELINQLTYCFFITWENSFLKVNQKDEKVRLLVIERSYNSVGNFLKKYIGEFFSITNFDELDCLTIDLVEIEKQYDVIVTDVMVGKSEELEIFFFYKMIPEAIIDRLNEFLNVSFTDNNVMVKNLEAPSPSKSHSDKEVQKPEKPDNSVKQATSS